MSEWMKHGVRRRDTAEHGVIAALREGGASVLQLTGRDVPDLLVGYAGQTHAVEVKTNRAKLKPGQARLAREWNGSPIVVARTPAQARKWLAVWRERRPSLSSVLRAEHDAKGGGSWQAVEDVDAAAREAMRGAGKDPEQPA